LGIGTGLFARFFLDVFRDLCWRNGKDYYHRLTYIAADNSQRMLDDVVRHGVLANHPGRYRMRRVDALHPDQLLNDVAFMQARQATSTAAGIGQAGNGQAGGMHAGRPFRAVFLNYLLDCLPAAALEWDDKEVRQLYVRTCVGRNVVLADYTDLTVQQL